VCVMCGSANSELVLTAEDHYTGEFFSLSRCLQCACVYTNPRPTSTELGHYYPPAYYGSKGHRFRGGLEKVVGLFRQRLADNIYQQFPTPGKILEVGSGRGTLLAELARRGWQATGTEYSSALAVTSINYLGVSVFPAPNLLDCQFETATFQVVVCYHVLEHLPNPLETLIEIRRIIHPEGLLIVAVPNFGGWIAQLSHAKWFCLDVPRHLFHFTPNTLAAILSQAGFEVQKRSTFSLEQDVFGFAQSCLNKLNFQFNLFYDLIRSQDARLRYHDSPFRIWGMLTILLVWILGILLSLIGLPITLCLGWFGKGGTLEFWSHPHTHD
jgi:2-polyprenyl-3-methyl-5-hydroxy-6-metoxy-1,4-benzoquinol methylase